VNVVKKVIVNGAYGKMGELACQHIEASTDLILAATAGRQDDLAQIIQQNQADMVLDLTNANAVWSNANIIIDHGLRPIIGSSGLSADQIHSLQSKAKIKQLSGIIVPNFSIGAVLMMQCAEIAAQHFTDCAIVETHHPAKIDQPSGTARASAERIQHINQHAVDIHSIRLPGVIANQQITFGGLDETLCIEHNTISREAFMPGIILACRKVTHLHELVVGLEHCLDASLISTMKPK
jgi:4-hydroxy-tetrahydrodipicolinate reductase